MALQRDTTYPGRFAAASTAQPQGAFKNRTSTTSKDGSYLEQDWANDWSAFFSSLLDNAGVSPDGNVDEVGASQYFDALEDLCAINDFSASTSGYTKLPSGIILQWGQFTQTDNGSAVAYTFSTPITFPTACLQAFSSTANNIATGAVYSSVEGLGVSSVSGFTVGPSGSRIYRILAIGY